MMNTVPVDQKTLWRMVLVCEAAADNSAECLKMAANSYFANLYEQDIRAAKLLRAELRTLLGCPE